LLDQELQGSHVRRPGGREQKEGGINFKNCRGNAQLATCALGRAKSKVVTFIDVILVNEPFCGASKALLFSVTQQVMLAEWSWTELVKR